MIQPILQLLFACSGIIWAQPTDITVTATFPNGQTRYLLGTETNGIAVDIIPSAAQTISPTTTGFVQLLLAQARVTVTGNPFLTSFAVGARELTFVVASGQQSTKLTASLSINYEYNSIVMGPRPVMTLGFTRSIVTPVAGVAYSFASSTMVLWDAVFPSPPPATYSILGKATRGTLSFSINSLHISAVAGQPETRTFTVNGPSATILQGSYSGLGLSFNGNVVTATVNHTLQKPTSASFLQMFWADGIPPAYLPVRVDYIPGDSFLRLSPTELTFVYTQGSSPPPPQIVNIATTQPATISNGSYDSGWMSATQNANQITVNSLLTSKPTGRHRTILRETASPGYSAELYINFYVNNGPGVINATPQPSTAGTVRTAPASGYINGQTVTLTATPNPGFLFGRWTGVVNDTANPISFVLNGPTNITAEFLPVTGHCTYTLSPPAILTSARADIGRVEIRTQSGCPWTVSQLPSWMRLNSPASGTGSGYFSYTLDATPNVVAFLRVADGYLKVEKTTCNTSSPVASESVPAAGGEITVRFADYYSCYYTLRASQPWIQSPIPDIYWLAGPLFAVTAQPNDTGVPRAASLSVGGYRTPFIQRAANPTAPYDDVNESNLFADHIAILKANNAADSCGANRFCPDDRMLRSQMAELLVRARLGTDTFTFVSTPVFQDVPASHPQFKWIQKLAELNITNGCAANQFCPADGVTRAQMALFLVRARAAIPPSTTLDGSFSAFNFIDVPSDSAASPFIAKMREWGVTNGCYENAYCPDDFTTRGQMAAFVVRAFFTP